MIVIAQKGVTIEWAVIIYLLFTDHYNKPIIFGIYLLRTIKSRLARFGLKFDR